MTRAAESTWKHAATGGGLAAVGFTVGVIAGGWAPVVGAALGCRSAMARRRDSAITGS
jgi:hypothetical protein